MAAKFLFFIALAFTAAVVSADNCNCDDEDTKEVWQLLTKLSKEVKEDFKDLYSVPAGFLSPLLDCNCLEKARKKRAILPAVPSTIVTETELPKKKTSEESQTEMPRRKPLWGLRKIQYGTRLCPLAYARVGRLCIKEELLD